MLLGLTYQFDYLNREGEDEGAGHGGMSHEMEAEALRGQVHTGTFNASLGVSSWFTVGLLFPFTYKSQDVPVGMGETARTTGGIGDPLLLLKFTLWGHEAVAPGALRLGLIGGIKLPVGRSRARDDLGRLPQGFQVSSGALDLLAGVNGSWGPAAKTQLLASVTYRHSFKDEDEYAFGEGVTATADVQIAHLYPLAITGGLRLAANGSDSERGEEVPASSALLLSAHLGLTYFITPSLFVNLDALTPMYWKLEGAFLTNRFTGVLGVTVIL